MRKRIAHVVLDEKFIDNAISIFDSLAGVQNEYLVVSRTGQLSMIHMKDRVTVFASQRARLAYLWKSRPDVIVLHSLFFGATLAALVSRKSPVVWVSWGNDLYKDQAEPFCSSYPFRRSLFMPETRAWLAARKARGRALVKTRAVAWARNVFRRAAIKRVRFVSTCLPYELPAIHARYPHVKRFGFDYIDKTAMSLPRCNGASVLVGNSGSPNSNHLDVLKIMAGSSLTFDRILAPLSYAGGSTYHDRVTSNGKELFGGKFVPLDSYMGIDEYARLLRSCGYAVMGFLRQQATKTLQLLLYQGSKIYFFKETEIFAWFKEAGYAVFSVEDDLQPSGFGPLLGDADYRGNQALVEKQFNYEANLKDVASSVAEILGTSK